MVQWVEGIGLRICLHGVKSAVGRSARTIFIDFVAAVPSETSPLVGLGAVSEGQGQLTLQKCCVFSNRREKLNLGIYGVRFGF